MERATEGSWEINALLLSFVAALLAGVVYGVIRVESLAPPIAALLGLFGTCQGSTR